MGWGGGGGSLGFTETQAQKQLSQPPFQKKQKYGGAAKGPRAGRGAFKHTREEAAAEGWGRQKDRGGGKTRRAGPGRGRAAPG